MKRVDPNNRQWTRTIILSVRVREIYQLYTKNKVWNVSTNLVGTPEMRKDSLRRSTLVKTSKKVSWVNLEGGPKLSDIKSCNCFIVS